MKKKVLVTVGGTGGHVYPALALGKQLIETAPSVELLYVGGNLAINPYFDRNAFSHQTISCATFKKRTPWAISKSLYKIFSGIKQSLKIMKEYNPDLVVGFGSYYTLPVLIAAKLKGIPFVLHEANSIPGKVNRFLSKYASAIGIHFPSTATMLKGPTHKVSLPLRPGYKKDTYSKANARGYFDLDSDKFTILIFGGSQGAVHLNSLVSQAFTHYLKQYINQWQVIHIAGDAAVSQILHVEYQKIGLKSCVKAFENRMDLAWQASDMCIARAGAGTIAEQMEFEVPGILIPYPHATDNHQKGNAAFLTDIVKGGITLDEVDLNSSILAQKMELFSEDKRLKMHLAMNEYKIRNQAKDFYNLILEELKK